MIDLPRFVEAARPVTLARCAGGYLPWLMADVARAHGLDIDVARLQAALGCPVVETVAVDSVAADVIVTN